MAFAENVTALAQAMGLEGPVSENLISIEKLVFLYGVEEHTLTVEAEPDNMKGRLFIEALARYLHLSGNPNSIRDLDRLRPLGEEFFAEYWEDAPGSGRHKVIDGLRGYDQVQITWKPGEEPAVALTLECLVHCLKAP